MTIVLEHINKRYGNSIIVRDFSLDMPAGEFFVLLGASGSGKSTLLKMIAGLVPQDSGRILLKGRDVSYLQPQERQVGFVFQNYSLFRHMTVAQNIAFGLEVRKVPKAQRLERVRELLELIELPEYGERLPSQLSGGQQQRVALARALAYQPEVLLLDEPFGALDVKIRVQLRRNLRAIQKQLGVTTILVTHDQEEAFELADRIGIIEGGTLLEQGEPSALYRRPQTPFTATFLGEANLLKAQRNGTQVYVNQQNLPAPADSEALANQACALMVRPEEVALALTPEGLAGQALGRATVLEVEFGGSQQRVTLQLEQGGQTLHALLSPEECRALALYAGQVVMLGVRDYHLIAQHS